jgi:NACHT domain
MWYLYFFRWRELTSSTSSAIIQDVMALRESESALMAYFYCDFRDEDKQYRRNMILSFLFQLSAQSNTCFDALWDLYPAHDDGAQKPSDGALLQCLKEVLSLRAQGRMYLILDALDECPQNSGMPSSREQALDLVKSLIKLSSPNLHICVTSRPEIDIRNALEPMTSFRVSLHEQSGQKKDIIEYVNSVVYSDIMMQRWREDDKRLVVETLSERAGGM